MSPKDAALTWEELPRLFPGFPEAGRWLPLLRDHLRLIEAAAPQTRVTAVAPAEAVRRQYAESLEILRIAIEAGASVDRVVDVGSGGGFPGLVIACVLPGSPVDLVEPLPKRARLLTAMIAELGLANVRVHAVRAEVAGHGPLRDSSTLVTARAVAGLTELLEYTAPLAATGGLLALPKGSGLEGELTAGAPAFAVLSCAPVTAVAMRPVISETIRVLLVEKFAATARPYPRRVGMASKSPAE